MTEMAAFLLKCHRQTFSLYVSARLTLSLSTNHFMESLGFRLAASGLVFSFLSFRPAADSHCY